MRPKVLSPMLFGVGCAVVVMLAMPPLFWALNKIGANPFNLLHLWWQYWAS